jgi:molecular chaperone DnaK (HSP70)
MRATLQTSLYVFEEGHFRELLPPSFELPGLASFSFSTAEDGQSAMVIDLAKGCLPTPKPLVRIRIDDIEPAPKGRVRIMIALTIDTDSQMNLEVRNERSDLQIPWTMQKYPDPIE